MDLFLPRIVGFCIHIFIQRRSIYFHRQIFKPCPHWIQERYLVLFIYIANHGEITLWNTVGKQLRIRFGVPPHIILWIIIRWCWKTGTRLPIAPFLSLASWAAPSMTAGCATLMIFYHDSPPLSPMGMGSRRHGEEVY